MRLTLNVKTAWWVTCHLYTLQFFAAVMGTEPDYNKVTKFIVNHGMKFKVSK